MEARPDPVNPEITAEPDQEIPKIQKRGYRRRYIMRTRTEQFRLKRF